MTMRKELRKYSSIGNKAGILLFCKKILTGQMEDLSSIGISCSFINGVDLKFNCGVLAFEEINLISVRNGKCQATEILYSSKNEELFIEQLCRYCMNALIEMDMINIEDLNFNETKNIFQIPIYAFKMECAVYRNMLITFGALIQDGNLFIVNENFEKDFSKFVSNKRKLSQKQLLSKLEQERIIGEEGEQFVLNFELKRLTANAKQAKQIKQISLIDVAAGYDIISYNDNTFSSRRYIEVKTFQGKEHFYWSINEINSAKLRGSDYCLYLVDYAEIQKDGYAPKIIVNPYAELQNDDSWHITPNSFLIEKSIDEKEKPALNKDYTTPLISLSHSVGYPSLEENDESLPMAAE